MDTLTNFFKASLPGNAPLLVLTSTEKNWERYIAGLQQCQAAISMESVRALRIGARRLRTHVQLLRRLHPQRSLNKVARTCGEQLHSLDQLRDTQLMLAATSFLLGEVPSLASFRNCLLGQEKRCLRSVKRELRQVEPGDLARPIALWIEKLDAQDAFGFQERLISRLDELYGLTCQRLALLDPTDPSTIHPVRISFRKFRYILDGLHPFVQGFPAEHLERMKNYQDLMGSVQDLHVLIQTLADFAASEPGFDPEPALDRYHQRLADAVAAFLDYRDMIEIFWRPGPGQPFPWEKTI